MAALQWAFRIPIGIPGKSVLLALADHADENGNCWPSQDRLEAFSGCATRTVRKAVGQLVDLGLVVMEGRSKYHLMVGTPLAKPAQGAARSPRKNRHVVPENRHNVPPNRHVVPTHNDEPPEPPRTPIPPYPHVDLLAAVPKPPDLIARAVEAWNRICGKTNGAVEKLTDKRRARLKAIFHDDLHGSLERWEDFCQRVNRSKFLREGTDGSWHADFDWCIKSEKFVQIIEGKFDARVNGHAVNGTPPKTVDGRYFTGPIADIAKLPEPRWSTYEREAWLDAKAGKEPIIPEGYHAV